MISVLIPVYNYNITDLVKDIHGQISDCKVPFEIIVLEDGSSQENINKVISSLSHLELISLKHNIGRVAARQELCNKAKYEYLLFIDADVIPKSENYIKNYLDVLNSNYDVIYGGFAYNTIKPKPNFMLRWTYGKSNEEVPAKIRNLKPYKVTISANFLIKRKIFNLINSKIDYKGYGLDNYFGASLKSNQIKVYHIDNEVYHIGIEESVLYIQKKEKAAETLITLYRENKINNHQNDLLKLFKKLKRYKLNYIASGFYKIFKNLLKRNLTSSKPSIKILQLYRISYMCYFDLNAKTI
ncbi:glycosyltransferase family 2 protein [Winogradskyella echinorum]|uniref:Glycosyltransferase family 2 protein n=1 Tax=Winogradskyella echinorum TaxID=538189 RepID=A0ABR6XXV9_9FLAO|nr:glycosyltransferase [Winogradskyella echinorum]MBC3844818.1 glycosyltransferase family 2 protein [Winogradskyella echinorum]MBC5749166.1 glycosyltransferase family 2 protein [Winogradskyella echinorum]